MSWPVASPRWLSLPALPGLPRHLAALVGSLKGPSDLGRNHDKYLAYLTEICHLLANPQRRGRVGLAAEFCAAVADDELRVIEVTPHDYGGWPNYSSLRLQAVDACAVALAERLDLHEVATLDRRDFQVVAPRHLPKGQRLTVAA